MSFKYDLTEFCTSIKPTTFLWLFSQGYERVVYFDPDIYIFSPIDEIMSLLKEKNLVLTPHVAGVHKEYQSEHPEWHIGVNGIYNLGFIGAKNSEKTIAIMNWWAKRLKNECFCERSLGQFTDQKWMDWIPALIESDSLCIIRHLGMNLAPWNFFERKIEKDERGEYYVSFREEDSGEKRRDKLIFVHYSGYDYVKLKEGIVKHKRFEFRNYPDIQEALSYYGAAIKENVAIFNKYIDQKYSYAFYSNGERINWFHRRLYNGLSEEQRYSIDPFSNSYGSFYWELRKSGMINNNVSTYIPKEEVNNLNKKIIWLNRFYILLMKILGFKRYVQFIKSLRTYLLPENHTFLINKNRIQRYDQCTFNSRWDR